MIIDHTFEPAHMGQFIRTYQPTKWNAHRLINDLFGARHAYAPSAIIIQEKLFPDVSYWQQEINWDVMRSKTDAAIIRAGGNVWPDAQFENNWSRAKEVGIKRGSYWFYDDRIDPGRQAALWVSLLGNDLPEMEFWCDWENTYGGSFGGLRNVVAFMQSVEALLPGVRVGLYTGYYWFRDHSNPITNATQYAYLKERPLWLGWYMADASQVLIPAPWTQLLLWQWGTPAVGALYGVQTEEIDMNTFNGTLADFENRYGVTIPPPGGTMPDHFMKLTPNVPNEYRSVRAETNYPVSPHILGSTSSTSRIIAGSHGKALPNDFYVYEADVIISGIVRAKRGDKWWKVYEASNAPIEGWSAEIHLGQPYLNVEEIGATDPTPTLPDISLLITAGDDVQYVKQTIQMVLKPK